MPKNSWVRTVYLYLFALVGLVLIVIGVVRLMNIGLRMTIFKEADKMENSYITPPMPPAGLLETKKVEKGSGEVEVKVSRKIETLTEEEKTALNNWELDYKNWQEKQSKVDYLKARRQSEASISLAFIIIGLPLYLYHWAVIKRDRKENA